MPIGNTPRTWGLVQRALHWTVALLVVCQLGLGFLIAASPPQSHPGIAGYWHPSIGFTICALMLIRLAWRVANPVPRLPAAMAPSLRRVAQSTHYAFYLLLIFNPIVGWVMVCAHGGHVPWWFFQMPDITGKNAALGQVFVELHGAFAFLILGCIALHVAGAIRHELVARDNVLRRMLPLLPMTEDRQARQDGRAASL